MVKVFALVIPSLRIGGMERVIVELANYFTQATPYEIHLIKLTRGENDFVVDNRVIIHEPGFTVKEKNWIKHAVRSLYWLRKTVKKMCPEVALSFGDRYNAFVVLACMGLPVRLYVSNRMNPFLSNGRIIDKLNLLLYPYAHGIIAQTRIAKAAFDKRYRNNNIMVIGNPIKRISGGKINGPEKNIILNVGRFDDQKNQELLLNYFRIIDRNDWELVFIGAGSRNEKVQELAGSLPNSLKVRFYDRVQNIEDWYSRSKIFAFTSTSEGFPNALAEAMSAGLACISFDCVTGPSDLIDDGKNGFLIQEYDHETYIQKLTLLMNDENLRERFGQEAKRKVSQFSTDAIGNKYLEFLSL
jgi:glycosyltransferase involved in cell wall biosynthesis